MNRLRIRFAIGFCLLFAAFLATSLTIIYASYADFRKDEFFKRLEDRAMTTFRFLVEVEQIDNAILRLIDKNTMNSLYDESIRIYKDKELIYESINRSKIHFGEDLFDDVKQKRTVYTTQGDYEVVAVHIVQAGASYTVFASAYDKFGRRKLSFLKRLIAFVFISGVAAASFASFFFVKRVIRPLDELNNEIQNIDSENLHVRLKQEGQGDEVDKLARSFNKMLERLEDSFRFQKNFVHYASHELRTPLTVAVAATENALSKSLTVYEHKELLLQVFRQLQELTAITNALLLLSDKKIDVLEYPGLRLDELVFRSIEIIRNLHNDAQIELDLVGNISSDDSMTVRGNEPLLIMAFNNLLKNAIQYSDNKSVRVTVRVDGESKEVEFKNRGHFLPEHEQSQMFTPFFRGRNASYTTGLGLGLPLVRLIAEVNKATVEYIRQAEYNVFRFSFIQ
jgi:signal transduction histidine kinase